MWHRTHVDADIGMVRRIGDCDEQEFTICFSGTYEPAFPGSHDEPPEGEGFEIEDMAMYQTTWSKDSGHGIDLTSKVPLTTAMLTRHEIDAIRSAGIEAARTMIERRAHRERE